VFKGTYRYKIDPKGRLPVPAPFRRALRSGGGERVVATLVDQCIALFPIAEWTRLEDQLRALPPFGRTAKALARHLASRAVDAELDAQGRLLLAPALREAAGLGREAVVVGVLDRIEIWSPQVWDRFLKDTERLLEDVSLEVAWPMPPAATPGKAPAGTELPQAKPKR
jgi:MraZ protein